MHLARILKVIAGLGLILLFCAGSASLAATPVAGPAAGHGFELLNTLAVPELPELSGLAVSHRRPDLWWAINDSGNPAELVALTGNFGEARAVAVEGQGNHDWEDLASFELEGQPWLLIADTGDNFGLRSELQLILVPEPEPEAKSVLPSRVIRFRFADGARDCEAVAVDAPGRRVLLADKGRQPVGLYELPLEGEPGIRVAKRIADFPELVPTPARRVQTLGGGWGRGTATSMDVSADGLRLLVISYLSMSLFQREPGQSWSEALLRPLLSERLPQQIMFESVGLSADGRFAMVATERQRAQFFRRMLPPR